MSTITEQIISKLHRLEELSEPTLTLILDFVSVVESRLLKESDNVSEKSSSGSVIVSCFDLTQDLIGIGDELPADLSTNKDYMAGYGL